jgi:flagellar hook-length control protein FliK
MFGFQFSSAAFSFLNNVGQSGVSTAKDAASQEQGDGFGALLDAVGTEQENAVQPVNAVARKPQVMLKPEIAAPSAAPVKTTTKTPASEAAPKAQAAEREEHTQIPVEKTNFRDSAAERRVVVKSSPDKKVSAPEKAHSAASDTASQPAQRIQDVAGKVVSANTAAEKPTALDEGDEPAKKLEEQVNVLSGLLAIISQFMSPLTQGAFGFFARSGQAEEAQAVDAVATDAQVSDVVIDPSQALLAAGVVPVAATVQVPQVGATDGTQPQLPASELVARVNSVLEDMQKLLAAQNNASELSPEAAASLADLNAELASYLEPLKAALSTPGAVDAEGAVAENTQLQVALQSLDTAKDDLKVDVDAIRSLLKKWTAHTQHAAAPVTTPSVVATDASLLGNDVAASSSKTADAVPQPVAAPAPQAVAATVQFTPANQATAQDAAAANAGVVSASGGQSGAGSSSGNFSGSAGQQQQGSTPMQSLSGLGSGTTNTTASSSANSFSQTLQRASTPPMLEQVVFHVRQAAANGNSKIHIQLDPVELGKLDIKLAVDAEGKTSITVIADSKQTLDMLQKDSQGLQKALADVGLKTDSGSLSFNLRGGQQEQGQGRNEQQASHYYRKSQPEEEIISPAILTRSYVVTTQDGLDIKI